MRGGNKTLKRIFYQLAFASMRGSPESRAYYDRKRREGERHTQALVALAGESTSYGLATETFSG
jgi:transposase